MASPSAGVQEAPPGSESTKSHRRVAGYRSDIDGLRTVAVVPVVIFHIAQSFIPGGYVGVDIFFVISGFLISSNIFHELRERRFSLGGFYERRVRRIVPAYLAVLAFVTAVVLLKYLPSEAASFGHSLVAAITSVTNIYFWQTTNYFSLAAEEMPLLHTWSLSVEEQFYLVFPLMLIGLNRWARGWTVPAVVGLFAVSLCVSIPGAYLFPSTTFYLLPTRAWELLIGAILAANVLPPPGTQGVRDGLGIAGLAMIGAPMLLYGPYTAFPGLAAVPPCLGAALIIYAGQGGRSLVGRLLSLPPIVFVGLISYSLYLWHWPLLALQRTDFLLTTSDSKLVARGAVLGASFLCAILSWWLIERPTRNRTLVPSRRLLPALGVAVAGGLVVGAVLTSTDGFPGRFTPSTVAVARYLAYDPTKPFREGQCFLPNAASFSVFDRTSCAPRTPGRRTELLLGDSHAAALYAGLHHALPDVDLIQVTCVRCPPIVARQHDAAPAWAPAIDYATNVLPASRQIDRVWLVARWNRGEANPTNAYNAGWLGELLGTVETFRAKGIPVVVVGPMPEYREPLPRLLAKAIEKGDADLAQRSLFAGSPILDRRMGEFSRLHGVTFVSLASILCPSGRCREYVAPGVPLLFDGHHLTEAGSRYVAAAITAAQRPAL